MTVSVTAGSGAVVPLACLDKSERNSLSASLSRGDCSLLSGGSGGGWSLEREGQLG